jgi:hypothetical protein
MEGVLRRTWGFEGVTVSDFIWGLRDAARSLSAGLDVEEPFQQQRALDLPADLAAGRASWSDVDRAARRILRTQIRHYATRAADDPSLDVVFSSSHQALAREAAGRAMVLLKNDPVDGTPVLPLPAGTSSIAVIGRLAGEANTGDHGSSDVRSPSVVTALQGLTEAFPSATIRFVGDDDPVAAASAAAECDVAVVVAGYTALDEGEYIGSAMFADPALLALFPPVGDHVAGKALLNRLTSGSGDDVSIVGSQGAGGDRAGLRLRPVDGSIIRAVSAANPRTVVAVVTAGAVITEEWRDAVPAVLFAWYSGSLGGHALADVLRGAVDAAGRLPFSIPVTEEHLPYFDRDATAITYDKWFGQRLLDRDGHAAAFPLGFGLSYSSFALSGLSVGAVSGESFPASVTVTNTGARAGRHVVQLYARVDADPDFPSRVLVGFAPVALDAGTSAAVSLTGSIRPWQRWTPDGWVPAASSVVIEAAAYAGDPSAVTAELT